MRDKGLHLFFHGLAVPCGFNGDGIDLRACGVGCGAHDDNSAQSE
jgi:hypothetical protein